VAFAVELRLDRRASDAVAALWAALDRAGETSLSARHAVPHVSLAVFETLDQARVEGPVAGALTGAIGLELTLGSLGFFVGKTTVAFLGVAPTRALLEVHGNLLGALAPGTSGLWEHYRADALVPHCTLAMAVRDPGVVASAVDDRLPIAARVAGAALVDVPTGRPLIDFAGLP
jgi:hypothetical protein